jgi:branched-chain amino acid transport system ATP-binding protein
MLKLSGVETFYGTSQALFGMELEIESSEVITLLGRNGMGKTTTVRSIMGLTPPANGVVDFQGHDLRKLQPYRIAKLGLGLVPEGRRIFPNLTVSENLIAAADQSRSNQQNWDIERVHALFPSLNDRRRSMGSQLSGGEQQMLAIGRALMTNPKLLILDEATEGLAPLVREEIWQCLKGLKESGQAILLIDKNLKNLLELGDRHYIIEKGRIVWSGDSTELRADEKAQHNYLGV